MAKRGKKDIESVLAASNKKIEEIQKLIDSDELPEALSEIKKLQKKIGESYEICILWGKYYLAKRQNTRAEEWLLKAHELNKSATYPYEILAAIYESYNEPDKVIHILWEGARDSSDPLRFYVLLENTLIQNNRRDLAVEMVKEINKRYKNKNELHYKKGEAAYYLKLYPMAIDCFRKCIDHDPPYEHLYNYLAYCFREYGYFMLAQHYLAKAIRQKPDIWEAYNEIVAVMLAASRSAPDDVLTGLQLKAAELSNNLGIIIQQEFLSSNLKKINEACEAYIENMSMARDNPIVYTYLSGKEDIIYEKTMFAEFFNNVILSNEEINLSLISAYDIFGECIEDLKEIGADKEAQYYQAWNDYFNGLTSKAFNRFTALLESGEISFQMREGVNLGLQKIGESSDLIRPERRDTKADPILSKYGFLISDKILKRSGNFYGMDNVMSKIFQTLRRDSKSSIILTGASGAGKTAAVYQLARELKSSACPKKLQGFSIYQVSTSSIMAGAKFIGMWQERLQEVCQSGSVKNKVILYFEDIENIFGAGRTVDDKSNFSNYLIPRIEAGEIIIMAELDSNQAQTLLWENKKFERVISLIEMKEPSESDLYDIVASMATDLEKTRNTEFSQRSLSEIIDLTKNLMPNHAFPGKAIDLMKGIADAFGSNNKKDKIAIDPEDVILKFSEATDIPNFIIDKSQLIDIDGLRKFFRDRILGQDFALESVMNAITAFKARLYDDTRPVRSFLFVGPTGVGKTETAKVLAEYLFSSQDNMIRLNMSEYSDKDAVAKLLGSGPEGERKSSRFLDDVRKNPFNVVLLDEIEKANPDFYNILLQLLDEGTISDASEKPVYFRSSIIIMTSNIGARHYTTHSIGFGDEEKVNNVQGSVLNEVKNYFSPEIFNRFDEVVCFRPLGKDVLETIINREIGKVFQRRGIAMLGATVDVDPLVKEYIVEAGYDPKYGARHIKRVVEKAVALPLARLLASTQIDSDDIIRINVRNGEPSANCIRAEETSDEEYRTAESDTESISEIQIPGRSLKNMLESMESRVESLKARFEYTDACKEKEALQERMNKPNFWDDHKIANKAVKRFAELNKRTDRIHKWDRLFEQIMATASVPKSKLSKYDVSRIRSQLVGLTKELESAELEVLLEGKYDSSDAFLMLTGLENSDEDIKWVLEMSNVYYKWAKRRGYYCKIFGEDTKNKSGEISLFMHIAGLNTYGLLKNEMGIHRKILTRQPSHGPQAVKKTPKSSYDCRVLVLPDTDYPEGDEDYFSFKITKLKASRKGMKIRSIKYNIEMKHKRDGVDLQFYSDSSIQKDKNLASDLFKAFIMNYRKYGSAAIAPQDSPWGSIVRTYESGDRNRVIDHYSKIVIQNHKDYLNGKIDSLLLERII